jgi:YhcH/YjgK/YiaL family protein
MILDVLANARIYSGLAAPLAVAFDFLLKADHAQLPLGKTSIDGDRLFALIQEYYPKPESEGRYEAHRRYWDVQYVASGEERMGYAGLGRMTITEPHDQERDVAFYGGQGDLFLVPAGSFTVFGPQDVHMPGIAPLDAGAPARVRKIVLKVEMPR